MRMMMMMMIKETMDDMDQSLVCGTDGNRKGARYTEVPKFATGTSQRT